MLPNDQSDKRPLNSTTRSSPHCPVCRTRSMVHTLTTRDVEVRHDGRSYSVQIVDAPVWRCGQSGCDGLLISEVLDDKVRKQLRTQLGLLQPEEIRGARERLGMSQKELAEVTGFASETLSRWENGMQVQSAASDKLLRLILHSAAARALCSASRSQSVLTSVSWPLAAESIARTKQKPVDFVGEKRQPKSRGKDPDQRGYAVAA